MPHIHLSKIVIKPNRQRQEFQPEALVDLRESIEKHGLLHAPVLRKEGEDWVLVAGESRIKAIKDIFDMDGEFIYDRFVFRASSGLIPFIDIGELDELAAEEAELDENLKRRDLTWQELAAAHDRLHKLRGDQKIKKVLAETALKQKSGIALDPTEASVSMQHTIADTAKEVFGRSDGEYQNTIRKEVIVAKHLDNPAVAKAKSLDEAFKILKKEEERARNIELAAEVGKTFTADMHEAFNINCLDYMRNILLMKEVPLFDVICTDPPYGMDADSFGDGAGKLAGIQHHYDDSYEAWLELMKAWAPLSFAVTKPQAHAYVFCDFDNFHVLKDLMQKAGWYVFRTPFVVHKVNSGRVPLPDRGPRRQYELALYAIKGNKPVTHIYPDVISCPADDNTGHGAQKPVALFQNLLQRSVRPGDRVLDCFAGSGPIFEAAHALKCISVGIELDPGSYGKCLKRLQDLKALEQPEMFGGV